MGQIELGMTFPLSTGPTVCVCVCVCVCVAVGVKIGLGMSVRLTTFSHVTPFNSSEIPVQLLLGL